MLIFISIIIATIHLYIPCLYHPILTHYPLVAIYVNDLFAEIVDGVILLKIIDLLRPGMVNSKKISLQTSSRFKKVGR